MGVRRGQLEMDKKASLKKDNEIPAPGYVELHSQGVETGQTLDFSKYLNLKGKDRLPDDDDDF